MTEQATPKPSSFPPFMLRLCDPKTSVIQWTIHPTYSFPSIDYKARATSSPLKDQNIEQFSKYLAVGAVRWIVVLL